VSVFSGEVHGWRNVSSEPLVALLITTTKLAKFFEEVGMQPVASPPPGKAEDLARIVALSSKYGCWNATPEENAAVGIYF
jgi:hypothetical protein